jgi:hypothetical protein
MIKRIVNWLRSLWRSRKAFHYSDNDDQQVAVVWMTTSPSGNVRFVPKADIAVA